MWGQIESVASCHSPGKYPRTGFTLKAQGRTYRINDRDNIGPSGKLKEAFRIIAREASSHGIPVQDQNEWAEDLLQNSKRQKRVTRQCKKEDNLAYVPPGIRTHKENTLKMKKTNLSALWSNLIKPATESQGGYLALSCM